MRRRRVALRPPSTGLQRFEIFSPKPEVRRRPFSSWATRGDPAAARRAGARARARAGARDPRPGSGGRGQARAERTRGGGAASRPSGLLAASRSEAALAQLRTLAADDPDPARARRPRAARSRPRVVHRPPRSHRLPVQRREPGRGAAPMSLGLAITFGLMGVINMAHGEMLMIGSYTRLRRAGDLRHALARSPGLLLLRRRCRCPFWWRAWSACSGEHLLRFLYGRPAGDAARHLGYRDRPAAVRPALLRRPDERELADVAPRRPRGDARARVSLQPALHHRAALACPGRAVGAPPPFAARAHRARGDAEPRDGRVPRRLDAADRRPDLRAWHRAGRPGRLRPRPHRHRRSRARQEVHRRLLHGRGAGRCGNLMGTVLAAFGIGVANKLLEPAIGGTAAAVYAKVAVLAVVIWFLQWRPTGIFAARGPRGRGARRLISRSSARLVPGRVAA